MSVDFKDFQKLKWYYQVLVTAGVGGLFLFLAWYQYPGLSAMGAEIVTQQGKLDELQKTIAQKSAQQRNLAQLKKAAQELEVKLNSLKTVLPLERETDKILNSIPGLARESELVSQSMTFGPGSDHEAYTDFPIDMEVTGTYHHIGEFLDKIRNYPQIVNISGLQIRGQASRGAAAATASVSAKYRATTFVYKEEQTAPAK